MTDAMTRPMVTDAEAADLARFHKPTPSGRVCGDCNGHGLDICTWPCVPSRLLAARDEFRRREAQLLGREA